MRLEKYFETVGKTVEPSAMDQPMSLTGFAFGPMGMTTIGHWGEIYRLAYERTIEALRPTHYDRAMLASAN